MCQGFEVADGDAILRLVAACESFDVPVVGDESISDYTLIGELAHHVVGIAGGPGGQGRIAPVLAEADALLISGDPQEIELVTIGLLEDVQNIASHVDVAATPAIFEPWLSDASREAWDTLDNLWAAVEADVRARSRARVMDLRTYESVQNEGLRRTVQRTFRRMGAGVMVGIADVLCFEADQGGGLHLSKVR